MKKEAERRPHSVWKTTRGITRGVPHGRHLVTLFPFLALLLEYGLISPFEILLFILPFVFAITAGFIYNGICDAEKDPAAKNPITRGDLSKKRAFLMLALSLSLATIFFVFASRSAAAILLFGAYMGIWFAYSGLGIRLKESIFGPVAASFVLWSGPPLLLLVSFNYFSLSSTLLLLGLFILYVGFEIRHTVIDHDLDLACGCKTFAVILGKKHAAMAEYATLIMGSVFLLSGAYYAPASNTAVFALFAALFAISTISTVLYGVRCNYDPQTDVMFLTLPYIVTKMFLITYGLIVLRLPPILIFFVLWFYLMVRYP